MSDASSQIVVNVVQQHAEDAAILHTTRTMLQSAAHVKLHHLQRFDDRISAHLDGLAIAGDNGLHLSEQALERPSPGRVFTVAIRAIEDRRVDLLDRLFALVEAVPGMEQGIIAAFRWVERNQLRGIVVSLLDAENPLRRAVGIASCAAHHVDPGLLTDRRIEDPDPLVRARAWRTLGELGSHQAVSTAATAATGDPDPQCAFWAAWSAVILGHRGSALDQIVKIAMPPGPFQSRAFRLAMQVLNVGAAHEFLRQLASEPANSRKVIRGTGLVGDPKYIPWLIGQMSNDPQSRIAGEAFSLVTGLDLAWLDLERTGPEDFEAGPNSDPDDALVAMDDDDGLPWPDPVKIQNWWDANARRFQPGVRYFMGEPLNRENCVRVLKEGFQRQRIAAALYLSLLNPGTPLFEWRAPSWRQQQELAKLS